MFKIQLQNTMWFRNRYTHIQSEC